MVESEAAPEMVGVDPTAPGAVGPATAAEGIPNQRPPRPRVPRASLLTFAPQLAQSFSPASEGKPSAPCWASGGTYLAA